MNEKHSVIDRCLRVLFILGLTACFVWLALLTIRSFSSAAGTRSATATATAAYQDNITETGPFEGTININTANADELVVLSGVGTNKANAILAYREKNGPFHYPQDITYVSGIGETIFNNNKDLIGI